jgi:flavin reductase (DIM6/NTAB) family NADH-FMN oxidoreductase RutF
MFTMEQIPLKEATRLIFPRLTVLVTTKSPSGQANAAPYSWVAPVSFEPPMLYLGIQRRETRTIKNMRATKEFAVNVVTKDWVQEALNCESKEPDKVEKSGIRLKESKKIDAPSAEQAKIVLECRLKEIIKAGDADHFLIIGEIIHAEQSPGLKSEEIVMHLLGEKFTSPGKEYTAERKK